MNRLVKLFVVLSLGVFLMGDLITMPLKAAAEVSERLTEIEHLKLQLLVERQKRLNAEYEAKFTQFQALPEVASLLKLLRDSDTELAVKAQEVMAAHGKNAAEWRINVEGGEFVPAPK